MIYSCRMGNERIYRTSPIMFGFIMCYAYNFCVISLNWHYSDYNSFNIYGYTVGAYIATTISTNKCIWQMALQFKSIRIGYMCVSQTVIYYKLIQPTKRSERERDQRKIERKQNKRTTSNNVRHQHSPQFCVRASE